jgi:hypothetical protein
MPIRAIFAGLTILTVAVGGLTGCSSEPPGTDSPIVKQLTKAEIEAGQKKVMEGMKTPGGGYKGAPGAPMPKQ